MDWSNAYIHMTKELSGVNVYPGQLLTVWLNRNLESGQRSAVQVELRVLPNGKLQLFSSLGEVEVRDFSEWSDHE